jgi:hypothetical protein
MGHPAGWETNRSVPAVELAVQPAPAWPRLRVLLLDVASVGGMEGGGSARFLRMGRSSVDDALLTRLAGGSPLLQARDCGTGWGYGGHGKRAGEEAVLCRQKCAFMGVCACVMGVT